MAGSQTQDRIPMQDWKIAHRSDVLHGLRKPQSNPIATQLILSDLCNQDCWYCAYRMSGYPSNHSFYTGSELVPLDGIQPRNPKRQMSTPKAMEILEDLQAMSVESVEFTGGGEPTIHPDFARIVQDARSRNLEVGVVTNGLKLTEAILEAMDGISWVRVSIDSPNPATYARIRRTGEGALARVLTNLGKIRSRHLGVSFIVTTENYRQISQFRELIQTINPNIQVRFGDMWGTDPQYYTPEMLQVIQDQLTPQEFRYFQGRKGNQFTSPWYSTCWQQRINTYIGANLHVYRCCHYAYNPQGLLGSLETQRFRELWQSLHLQEFDASTCNSCPFHTKNTFIQYLLSDAQHTEFL